MLVAVNEVVEGVIENLFPPIVKWKRDRQVRAFTPQVAGSG